MPEHFESPEEGIVPAQTAGTVVPDEGQSVGVYYQQMDERLKSALKRLADEYKFEDISARREEVRKAQQAREFWRGRQYIYWSETEQSWHLPSVDGVVTQTKEDQPKFDFVTNIYQAFGLSLIAVLSQSVPATRLQPQSVNQQGDVATAKAGNEVIRLIERNNNAQQILTDLAYYLWTDGKVGGYVRYVVDGQRFGYDEMPILEPGQMSIPPSTICPTCLIEVPLVNSGECPNCGAPLPEELYAQPAYSMSYPQQLGTKRFPRGQEVVDIVGALELRTPMWANKQEEFPYLLWSVEMHSARLKAAYEHVAEKIGSQMSGVAGETYEKHARLRIQYGGTAEGQGTHPYNSLVTYDRIWLRPWALHKIEDKGVRRELLEMFPEGVYCAFAGDVFCEARPESLDDHWVVMQAMPGDGQNRPAIGTSFISMQERFNTLANLIIENIEFGVPPIYVDSSMLNFDELVDTNAEPSTHYPVQAPPGKAIQDGFFQPRPSQIHQDAYRHMNDLLGPHGQFVTGGFPALFGGSMQNVDTAAGYAMARDQALGRTGIMYRGIKSFWGQLMLKGINVARTHRFEDIENSILGAGGQWMGSFIQLADLQGNVQVYEDTSEQFPKLWTQQRAIMLQLLDRGDPNIMAYLFENPDNTRELQRLLGLENFKIPFENERDKQMREITQLLAERPIEMSDNQQGVILHPSVPPDALVDNHEVEAQVTRSWLCSPEGLAAAEKTPEGWLNVRAHLEAHEAVLQQRQAAQLAIEAAEEEEAVQLAEPAQSANKE